MKMTMHKTKALRDRTAGRFWLADGGLETAMIFLEGLDLPHFASFTLLDDARGRAAMAAYFNGFMDEAEASGAGFMLDTATWRASDGWGAVMGLSPADMARINREAVAFARDLQAARGNGGRDVIVNGAIGPQGDAYAPDRILTADEAEAYFAPQVQALAAAGVDMVTAVTMSDPGQGIGIARAARKAGLPVAIGYTVETDGRLVSGMALSEAIRRTDAETDGTPAWYMINCAHPSHFRHILAGDWTARIGAIRANASAKSHAELDESTELDAGDIPGLAADYRGLLQVLPNLRVLGGCCGTDLRHVRAIGRACLHHEHA
jgi:S-methylmethionine-dependent homocysteine/selenocysteine methylase